VNRGDRRLQLVRTGRPTLQRLGNETDAFSDLIAEPETSVLLGHGDKPAVWTNPRRPARVGEEHERKEPCHLAVVG
jgi:hypothetical protein